MLGSGHMTARMPAAAASCTAGSRCPAAWGPPRMPRGLLSRPRQLFQRLDSRTQQGTCRRRGTLQVSALAPKKNLSLQQRVRIMKNVLQDQSRQLGATLSALPPVAALLQLLALVNRKLEPLFALVALVQGKATQLVESYNEFLAEETKRRWGWENRSQKEIGLWKKVPSYLLYFGCTLLYELYMPVSVLAAIVLPVYYAWVQWDNWWLSPVFLGALVMLPLKFVPWAEIVWVWPGLI